MNDAVHPRQTMGSIAPLANIAVAERAYARLMYRGADEPGLGTFHGPSGRGKSTAAAWLKARYRAYYIQADDFWTKKTMLVAISKALGLSYTRTRASQDGPKVIGYIPSVYEMSEAIKAQLEASGRLLIIDEFDYCVEKNLVEAVRSLYEGSRAAILLIGEESLPQKLEAWERFHGRMLDWFPAEPAELKDAQRLAHARYPGVAFADDLLQHLVELARGSVRRIGNNLATIYDKAMEEGWNHQIDLAAWGERPLQSSKAPRREA